MEYITLPDGRVVEDRRNNELQTSVLKLVAKLESVESNIGIKLESVSDKIKNLDERLSDKINHIEKELDEHFEDDVSINTQISEIDKKVNGTDKYVERIRGLEQGYKSLSGRLNVLEITVKELQDKPKEAVYKLSKEIGSKVLWVIIGLIGAAIVFAFLSASFWERLK